MGIGAYVNKGKLSGADSDIGRHLKWSKKVLRQLHRFAAILLLYKLKPCVRLVMALLKANGHRRSHE